ncbi:hypothetical protein QBC36DRAFT_304124 [Triangularia setosa]|uniref:C2H2-type domain-containing protein n=1 Tax=Triangularia setosa TaxID=2587417 RepID=A0AAN6W0W8_9PEZI|nr:hypothetical protein QBC36DRAFT_304124 [Podospora setosa]
MKRYLLGLAGKPSLEPEPAQTAQASALKSGTGTADVITEGIKNLSTSDQQKDSSTNMAAGNGQDEQTQSSTASSDDQEDWSSGDETVVEQTATHPKQDMIDHIMKSLCTSLDSKISELTQFASLAKAEKAFNVADLPTVPQKGKAPDVVKSREQQQKEVKETPKEEKKSIKPEAPKPRKLSDLPKPKPTPSSVAPPLPLPPVPASHAEPHPDFASLISAARSPPTLASAASPSFPATSFSALHLASMPFIAPVMANFPPNEPSSTQRSKQSFSRSARPTQTPAPFIAPAPSLPLSPAPSPPAGDHPSPPFAKKNAKRSLEDELQGTSEADVQPRFGHGEAYPSRGSGILGPFGLGRLGARAPAASSQIPQSRQLHTTSQSRAPAFTPGPVAASRSIPSVESFFGTPQLPRETFVPEQELSPKTLGAVSAHAVPRRHLSEAEVEVAEDHDGRRKKARRATSDSPAGLTRSGNKFACPYFKRNPRKYQKWTSCPGPGWEEVHRVKTHLYRRHRLPIQCPRCWDTFDEDTILQAHLQQDPPCIMQQNRIPHEGFTKDQEKKLRSRKKAQPNMTDEDKWVEIYMILFPDDDPDAIPTPYYDDQDDDTATPASGLGSGSGDIEDYTTFLRREMPTLVRRELEVLFQNESRDVEDRLRSKVEDIMLGLQPKLMSLYRQSQMPLSEYGPPQDIPQLQIPTDQPAQWDSLSSSELATPAMSTGTGTSIDLGAGIHPTSPYQQIAGGEGFDPNLDFGSLAGLEWDGSQLQSGTGYQFQQQAQNLNWDQEFNKLLSPVVYAPLNGELDFPAGFQGPFQGSFQG